LGTGTANSAESSLAPYMKPTPLTPRRQSGPTWLSRSLLFSGVIWVVLFAASISAVFALAGAWNEIVAQHYLELGFRRSCCLVLENAADRGTLRGTKTALWFLLGG